MFKIILGYFSPYKAYPLRSLNLYVRGSLYVFDQRYLLRLLSFGLHLVLRVQVCPGAFSITIQIWYPLKMDCSFLMGILLPHDRDPCQGVHLCSPYILILDISNPPVLFRYPMDTKVQDIQAHLSASQWYLQTLRGCSPAQQPRHLP